MLDTILTKEAMIYKDLEEKVFKFSMEMGRLILQKTLEEYAKILDETRNKRIYRNKGSRKTVLKTKLGEVEYTRPMYILSEDKQKEVGKKSIYLLDEALEINKFGKMSENLVDIMIANINELSYRKSAENISTLTGQVVSGMGLWKVVQNLGEEIRQVEKVELYENDKLVAGEKVTEIIYQETDGVNISLQGKDRKKQEERYRKTYPEVKEVPKSLSKKELKIATTYEGWNNIGKNRYEVVGKEFVCGYIPAEEIAEIKIAKLHEKYNLNATKILINNKDGLKRYYHDEKIRNRLISLSEKTGLRYRHMGIQESENYCVLTRRMKRRRMSFSIRGSENLAKVLCSYHSESYVNVASITHIKVLPEELLENVEKYIKEIEDNIAKIKKIRIKPKKIYTANQAKIAEGYSNIRKILKPIPCSELAYL